MKYIIALLVLLTLLVAFVWYTNSPAVPSPAPATPTAPVAHNKYSISNGFTITTQLLSTDRAVATIQNDLVSMTVMASALNLMQTMWNALCDPKAQTKALTIPSLVTYGGKTYSSDGTVNAPIYNSTMNASVGVALLTTVGTDKLPFVLRAHTTDAARFTALLDFSNTPIATFIAFMNDKTNAVTFNAIISAQSQADLNTPAIIAMLGTGSLYTTYKAAMEYKGSYKSPVIMQLATYAIQFANDAIVSWGSFNIESPSVPSPQYKKTIAPTDAAGEPCTAFLSSYLVSTGGGTCFGLLLSSMNLQVSQVAKDMSAV